MQTMLPRIRIEELAIGYGDHAVQQGVSVDILSGEIFAIVGDSGSGKSTLLKTMVGLMPAQKGRVLFDGVPLDHRARDSAPPFGILFQNGALWTSMTVLENVAFPLRVARERISNDEIHKRVREALEQVEMGNLEERMATQLSGGQQQKQRDIWRVSLSMKGPTYH